MEFNIKIQGEDVKTIFDCLDMGPHGKVRRLLDSIFMQVQQQEVEARKAGESKLPTPQKDIEPGPDGSSTD